jgi:hypothetical protein
MRRLLRHLSVTAISLGMAGAAVAPAQANVSSSTPKAWRVVYWAPTASVHLASIAAPARRDAWVVGNERNAHHAERPLVLHWDGVKWARYTVPGLRPGCELSEVAASSPGDVWIFCVQSAGDTIYRWNGQYWRTIAGPPGGGEIKEAVVLSGSDVWVPGIEGCSGGPECPNIYQWNGSAWVPRPVGIQTVWFLSGAGRQVAAIGCKTSVYICHPSAFQWTGGRWHAISGPYRRRTEFPTIAVSPAGELWIQSMPVRHGSVIFYNRRSGKWHTAVAPNKQAGQFMGYEEVLTYDGHQGVWSGASSHWTGKRWISTLLVATSEPASMTARIAPIPGTASTWGLGGGAPCPSERCPRNFIAVFGATPH